MKKRKQIRVTLAADIEPLFQEAKMKTEEESMIEFSDTQFATRLLTRSILGMVKRNVK